jgi:hypothetical protein
MPLTFPDAVDRAEVVGRAILPAAAFQAALSDDERAFVPDEVG